MPPNMQPTRKHPLARLAFMGKSLMVSSPLKSPLISCSMNQAPRCVFPLRVQPNRDYAAEIHLPSMQPKREASRCRPTNLKLDQRMHFGSQFSQHCELNGKRIHGVFSIMFGG